MTQNRNNIHPQILFLAFIQPLIEMADGFYRWQNLIGLTCDETQNRRVKTYSFITGATWDFFPALSHPWGARVVHFRSAL